MIRVILAEDHNIVRNGIRNLLEKEPDIQVVAEAVNGREVLDMLNAGVSADLILADMNMPEIDGCMLTAQLRTAGNPIKILLLTMLDHERYVIKAFQAGANGYLLKNISTDELLFAVKHVHSDGHYFCSELTIRFLEKLSRQADMIKTEALVTDIPLSEREIEILRMIADGMTNQEIADQLFTSKRTVEGHRKALIDKMGVRNTAALVKTALKSGLIR